MSLSRYISACLAQGRTYARWLELLTGRFDSINSNLQMCKKNVGHFFFLCFKWVFWVDWSINMPWLNPSSCHYLPKYMYCAISLYNALVSMGGVWTNPYWNFYREVILIRITINFTNNLSWDIKELIQCLFCLPHTDSKAVLGLHIWNSS